jgi:hypothetical protein
VFLDTIPDVIVFDSLEEAKNFLINRFVNTINELVLEIEKNSIELFGQEDMPYSEANIQAE